MKKRVIPILIILAALISLLVLPTNAASNGVLMAGYCKVDIDPNRHPDGAILGLPMGGYGAVTKRLSGTIDPEKQTLGTTSGMDDNGDDEFTAADGLYATCTALTDQYGTTIIHFGVDNTNGDQTWTNDARTGVYNALKAKGYDVSYSNIFVTCSHSHSSPSLTFDKTASNVENYPDIAAKTKKYREWVIAQMSTAAVNAMADRVEVTMTKGSVDASDAIGSMYSGASANQKRMNWVRHYKSYTSQYHNYGFGDTYVGGSNFGGYADYDTAEVSSPNDVMHLVQFTPVSGSKKPILLVNWTAHATMNSTGGSGGANDNTYGGIHHYDTSADYIGALRYWLETAGACKNSTINSNYYSKVDSTKTYRVSFISGAAGNVTPTTSIMTGSQDPDVKGTSSNAKSPEGRLYGQKLAAIARYGLANNMTGALDTSAIRVQSKTFTYDRQQPTESDRDFIHSMREVTVGSQNLVQYLTADSSNWGERDNYYTQFPYLEKFTSRYQLSNLNGLVTNYYDSGKTTGSMGVSAIAIGTQLSFTVNPAELADRFSDNATLSNTSDNDWDDLISSTYGTPLVMGYTNGGSGYVPNSLAYNYNSGTGTGGDGADKNDIFITGSYESSGASFARGTGERLIEFYAEMLAEVNTTESRIQCECGGKAAGVGDHVCSNKEYLPWSDATSLPTSGNYYLTTNVTLSKQYTVNTLRLDLNGHNIIHEVTDTANSRVLAVNTNHTLTITDSTSKPGSIKRDLSSLTNPAISNWGLLVIIYDGGTYVQYGGILDSTGNSTTGGGSCVSANYSGSVFKMYGGTLTGGTAGTGGLVYNTGTTAIYGGTLSNGTATNGGLLYNTATGNVTISGGTLTGGTSELGGAIGNAGTLTIMGGTITGNKTKTNGSCPGIYVTDNGTLTIGGTANIDDNKKTSNSVEINIRFKDETKLATNFTVSGAFTGKAGIFVNGTHANGLDIGESNNASFTASNLWLDYKNDYPLVVSGDDIIMATIRNQCECGGKATSGKYGHTCKKVDFVPLIDTAAFTTGGNYYLLDNLVTSEQVTFYGKKVCLDLNGKSITHAVAAGATDTRVLSANSGAYLSVTDSTSAAGKITRDLSALTSDQKTAISNYGLLFYIGADSTAVLYNGTLDATGMYSGGGACISNHHASSTFKMYGGKLLGGISDYGGVMYNRGTAEFYGGTVTGGLTKNNSGHCGGISVQSENNVPGKITIGGNVSISGNKKSNGNETNIRYDKIANMADNFTVTGNFTGDVGIFIASADRSHNLDIGNLDNASFTANNLTMDYHTDGLYEISTNGNDIVLVTTQKLCECGGKAVGKYGHTCNEVVWTPWTDGTALPTTAGYYYLTTDVTTTAQKTVSAEIHIDLRGHDITHKVQSGSTNTRVFHIGAGGSLTITDSTDNPGTVTRDLSNLTTAQKEAITNYGLLVFLSDEATTGSFTLYNGTLDATGMYTCGGAITSLNKQGAGSKIVIYGGTVKGAISRTYNNDGGYAGAIYSRSPVEIHGGLVTGGHAQLKGGGVYLTSATSSLLLTGDGSVTGNIGGDGASNVFSSYSSTNGNVTVKGTFTGTVGFQITNPAANARVAVSDSAVITNANLSVDNHPSYGISVSGNKLVMNSIYAASITNGNTTEYITSLQDAVSNYPGGDAVLTILKDSSENITFTKDTILDLNGCDLTGTVTANKTLTVMDSQTDDLTIEDSYGYGKLPVSMTGATAAEGYIKITESDGISFHKLILQTVGINLRSATTGMYYTSDFGGDEVIKRNLKSFGIALGANKAPDFRDKTFTAFDSDSWTVGINSDGSTKNRTNGTILQGILSPDNTYSANKANAEVQVWGVAYIELNDNTRITESGTVKYSLRNIIEGYEGFNGADDLWANLDASQQTEAVNMYLAYEKVMKNWNIPNIKQALVDRQDDGILKVLVVGHSLGMDASYFTPMVARENGTEMVMGTLYHSGCKLSQHEDFLTRNVTEYAYIEYDNRTDTSWRIWENSKGANGFVTHTPGQVHDSYIGTGDDDKYGVTMQFGIQQHDWDVVIMMAGSAEGYGDSLDLTDIGVIRNYILRNDTVKLTTPKFAWNMTWSYPESSSVHGDPRTDAMNTKMATYNNNSDLMFADLADVLENQIAATYDFDYILPNGTAVQNLKSAGYTDEQIYRDRIHASDFTRLMIACNWYCGITGKDAADIAVPDVPAALRYKAADRKNGDYNLLPNEKSMIKSCVSNALANPYETTQMPENDDVLKVLVIGHSTGMDPIYFVPEIAKANGINMIVGDLYHSGCRLSQHENFIKNNAEEYVYLEYDNTNDKPWQIWQTGENKLKSDGTVDKIMTQGWADHLPNQAHDSYVGGSKAKLGNAYGVTMQWAIQQHDWDVIIMMGGRYETTDIFNDGQPLDVTDIGIIRDYVLSNDINKTTVPAFAWNTLWTTPENDEAWKATLTDNWKSSYESSWNTMETYYQGSTQCLYEHFVAGLKNHILPAYKFDYLLHNNTVIQNAKNYGLTNADIYRDYTHGTDFTRMMVAANWFCGITGMDVEDITIPSIPAALRFQTTDRNSGEAFTLTATEKETLIFCVKNAIENPYEVTKK